MSDEAGEEKPNSEQLTVRIRDQVSLISKRKRSAVKRACLYLREHTPQGGIRVVLALWRCMKPYTSFSWYPDKGRVPAFSVCVKSGIWQTSVFRVTHLPLSTFYFPKAGEETFFKIKKTTKMSKVFDTYAQRKGIATASIRFLLDGETIKGDQTPKMLELEDQDQIDCMLEQTGGME